MTMLQLVIQQTRLVIEKAAAASAAEQELQRVQADQLRILDRLAQVINSKVGGSVTAQIRPPMMGTSFRVKLWLIDSIVSERETLVNKTRGVLMENGFKVKTTVKHDHYASIYFTF